MIVDEKWIDWTDSTSLVACVIVENVICNNEFWRDADALQATLLPIVCGLHLCDSKGSTMGLLYEFMDRLRRAICDYTVLSQDRVQEMLDILRHDELGLITPQLDKLAYVSANLRVLEKVGELEDVGAMS
ncbi:hypothetical protein L7F22_044473 [Adiantum nelumboides]|nr:hypothetical protein [Adiantum nelumboides]